MKKLLTILGSVGLVATTSVAVIACGDKTQQKAPDKKEETKPTEEKKEEEKEKNEENKKEEEAKFPMKNLDLGGFFKDENKYNSFSQYDIKKRIAKLTNTDISTLTDLKIEYENESGKGTVKSTKYSDVLTFTFSNTLDLGKFKKENNAVSQLKVKKKIAEILGQEEKDLWQLNVDYENGKGSGSVKSTKTPGTLKIKFTIE
ncbi:lipoprotein [Mycoplasma mycoides]|uniref:lipoprotein n=1 Tax=Mycoplasma mycoides TaxID=2102 RepID=UPI002734B492|nr:lipoprotein [Mycoplasma mycoides]MDP4040865.1 lipoprotein [Mycoplasma mycoides]MDP4041741.1 lipoprotein [Mycoplasma mycoides]MDP4042626.1 lipoprotein [Mycoplasma mycoides]MDP4044096.1 lipoprotein [Mycoplasma mycoides]MDP4044965.1 lipoprotein [Mycoplasma mycoides]